MWPFEKKKKPLSFEEFQAQKSSGTVPAPETSQGGVLSFEQFKAQKQPVKNTQVLGFDDFKNGSNAIGFDEFVKPAKTPVAQPKPVDQIEHDQKPSFGDRVLGTGLSVVKGTIGATKSIPDVLRFGSNLASGGKYEQTKLGQANRWASQQMQEALDIAQSIKPESIQELEANQVISRDESGKWQINAPNPTQAINVIAESLPQIPGYLVGGKWIGAAGAGLMRVPGAAKLLSKIPGAEKAVATISKYAEPAQQGAVNAPIIASQTFSSTYDEVFQQAKSQGMSDEEAQKIATEQALQAGKEIAPVSAVTGAGLGFAQRSTGGLITRTGKGIIKEGVSEAPEETWQQSAQNRAAKRLDPSREIVSPEALNAGAMGFIAGGATGGVVAATNKVEIPNGYNPKKNVEKFFEVINSGEAPTEEPPTPQEQAFSLEPVKSASIEIPGAYKPKKNVRTFFDALESGDEEQVNAVSEKMSKKELEDTQRVLEAIKEDSDTTAVAPEKLLAVEDHLERVASLLEQKTTAISEEAKRIASGQPKTDKTPNLHVSDQEQVKKVIEKVASAVSPEQQETIKKQLESDINTNRLPGLDEAEALLNESNPFHKTNSIEEMEDIYQEVLVKNDARRGELDTQKKDLLGQKKAATDRTEKQNIQKLIDDVDAERRNLLAEEKVIEEQAQAKQLSLAQETIDKIRALEPNFNVAESIDTAWGMEDYQQYLAGLTNKEKPYGKDNQGDRPKQGAVSSPKPVGRGKSEVPGKGASKYAEKAGRDTAGRSEQPGERSANGQQLEEKPLNPDTGKPYAVGDAIEINNGKGKISSTSEDGAHFTVKVKGNEYTVELKDLKREEKRKPNIVVTKARIVHDESGVHAEPIEDEPKKTYTKEEIEALVKSKDTFTDEEKAIIAQYEGAGANRAEGRGLLDEFFTPEVVAEKTWRLVESYLSDTKDLKVLEPAVGTGRFLKFAPEGANLYAFETNPVSAKITQVLYPNAYVENASFETNFIDEKGKKKSFSPTYDVVVGNPPYGTHRGKYKGLGEEKSIGRYEEYFMKRALDLTKDGGIVAMVVPSSFMRSGMTPGKKAIVMRGNLLDAFRLPNGIFKGTEVGTDIVIFKKVVNSPNPTAYNITDDKWFQENPDKVLGTETTKKGRFGEEAYVEGKLEDAIEKMVVDREVAKEIAEEEVEATAEQEELEHVLPMQPQKAKEVQAETEAILKPAKRQPKDEKGKQERDKEKPYLIVSEKKDSTQIISQSIATEEQQYLFKNTLEDGSIDPKANFEKSEVNYQDGKYYTDFNYLQGNIYEKLKQLEKDKEKISEAQYSRQKKALESTLPKRMDINQITIVPLDEMVKMKLGDKTLRDRFIEWMKTLPYQAFQGSSSWNIMGYMNGEVVNVGDKARNREIKKQRREIGNRIFKKFYTEELEPQYQKLIEDSFNERYNGIVRPDYSQYPFSVELNQKFYGKPLSLRPIQLEGASFLVNKGAGLLAYEVGVGKTLAGTAAIAEVLRRGWAKRPLIVVPKNLRTKWIRDIMEALPKAKINDLGNLGRDLKYDGKWSEFGIEDGTISIITEEGFKRLGFTEETYDRLTKNLQDTTYSLKEKSARAKASEEVKAEEIAGMARRGTDFPITFEDLGFDHITFDEAHREKNVFASADVKKTEGGGDRKANEYGAVRGAVSERGLKAYLATQYVLEKNNGRNVFLLTATPFNNSPIEIYSILSLMAKKRLEEMGIKNINQFISLFVELENRLAIKANGTILEVDQVRKFQNLQQLQRLVTEYIDFRTGEEAGVPRPQKIRRKPAVKMNKMQAELVELAQPLFLDKEAGVLKAINELQKIALSPLLSQFSDRKLFSATPKEVVETSPKIRYAVEAIKKAHKANPKAGQIIFIEKGVEVFEPIRQYFIKELKYKPSEVAILDGSVKDAMRDEIQSKFQSGGIRILMTTIKEGIDLQERSTDLYNLYLPWNPTDLLQIEGRTWRQGSIYDKVRIHYPLLENSIDSFMFQKLEEKAARLESVFSYKGNDLDVSDIDFEAVKFELITDPIKRVEAEYAYLEGQANKKINLLKAEMSFTLRKADKLASLRNEMRDMTKYRDDAVKENQSSDILYWDNRLKKVKESVEEERERLKKSGIDLADIETRANEKQQELLAAEAELDTLREQKEAKKTEVAGKDADITFGDTDFEEVTKDMADRGFFQEMSYQRMSPRELQYLKEYGGRLNENILVNGYPQTTNITGDSIVTDEAIKIFRRFFTEEEYPVQIVNRIVAEDGGEAWGLTAPEMVKFVVNPREVTPYHEAVHGYMKKYVTVAQWRQILDEIKVKAGRPNMSLVEAEEMLADQFIYFVKERERAVRDQKLSSKIVRFFEWVVEQIKRVIGKQNRVEQFYEAVMEKKRPGFIQRVRLVLDRNPDIFKGTKYQEMTPEESERAKMHAIVARAFDKVFSEKRPPSLGKMIEEEFADKDRRTMLTAERLEAITENIAELAMTEGKQVGYLEAETSVVLEKEEKIKELTQKLKDQDYKNFEERNKLREKIGENAHERLMSIVKLHKKMERQAEVAAGQKARIQARFEAKKESLKDKQKLTLKMQQARFKAALKELQAIRDEMYEYVQEHLPRKRWAKFLTAMRDAKTRNKLKTVFEAVDEEVVRIQREEAVANIKRVLRDIEGIPLQYQMLIHKITDGINWQGAIPKTIKKLEKVKAYLESHPEAATSFPMRILKRLNILENKSYKDLTTEQLMGINAKLEMIMSVGENAKLTSKANLIKEKADKLALIQQTAQNFDIIKQSGITREEREKMTLWEKGLDKLQTTEFQLMPMDYFFLHWLDGDNEDGANYALIKRPIEEGFAQYWKLSNKIKGSVFDFINQLKEGGMETSDDMWDRIGMYAIRVQKGGTAKLLGSGYTKEQIDAVTLNENELALYGYLRKELDQMFPMIQEVYARVHNVQLDGVDDYFPFLMDWSNRAPVYQELEAQYNNKKGVSGQGFTISRVGGKNPVRINALESFLKHIDQAAYFIAMEERVRDAREIVSDKRYQLAVGEKAQAYLMRWLEVIERHGVPVDDKSIPFIDGVRRNITLGVLAFKLTTIPIQYTAVFNGAAHIGKYAFSGFTEIVTSKAARDFVLNASEQMKMRVGDSPEYNEEIPNPKLEKAREIGMWAIKKSDMQTASGVWLGAYKLYLDNHGLEFSMEDVNVEAQLYADRIVRLTQGSSEYKDLPPAMAQKYRTLGKLLLQFQTFAIYQYSYVRTVVGSNVSKDPQKAAWQFAMIATNILLVMQIRDLIGRAIWGAPDDDEEEGLLSRFAWELVQSIPLLGNQLYQVHRFMKSPTLYTALSWQSGVPLIDKALDVPRSIALAAISKEDDTKSKNIIKAGEAAGSLMGLPGATQIGQIWRAFIDE